MESGLLADGSIFTSFMVSAYAVMKFIWADILHGSALAGERSLTAARSDNPSASSSSRITKRPRSELISAPQHVGRTRWVIHATRPSQRSTSWFIWKTPRPGQWNHRITWGIRVDRLRQTN